MTITHTLERATRDAAPKDSHPMLDIAEATSAGCLATRVRQLSRIITRIYDDALRHLGITASQYTLLAQLASRDGITAVEIGTELDIEKSTLSRNLKRLLALGHIIMDPPAGRRGRGLHLTSKGQSVLREAYPVWQGAQSRTIAVMGPESRGTLDSLLRQAEKLAAV
ncbi:MAG: MarR family winged helix-turn-helix transcriptional regulator [Hyphomicrobium sp.]